MTDETKRRFKKRFIFLGAIALIIGIIAVDKVLQYFAQEKEAENLQKYEEVIMDADSTISILDEAQLKIQQLKDLESKDSMMIDSLNALLKYNDSLNEKEKKALLKEIATIEDRRDVYANEIVMMSEPIPVMVEEMVMSAPPRLETVVIYDTVYLDTNVYRYNYIDTIMYIKDTVIKVDTLLIEDEKAQKKILKKYGK